MTIAEVAKLCQVSRSLVYKWIKAGLLHPEPANPLYQRGGKTAIKRAEVESMIARLRPKPQP